MYKKILVPLDGSPLAECTLSHVIEIGRGCQVLPLITLFMAIDPMQYTHEHDSARLTDKFYAASEEKAREYLNKIAEKLHLEGLNTEIIIEKGESPAKRILDFSEKNGIDLIVISTYGSSGITRWLTGSTAEKVMRHARVPVLLVSPESWGNRSSLGSSILLRSGFNDVSNVIGGMMGWVAAGFPIVTE